MGGVSPAGADTTRPSIGRMFGRALRRRCPRCGSGGLFTGWFTMAERCPRCSCDFAGRPEEGFFLGAFTINLTVTLGILLLGLFAYIVVVAGGDGSRPPLAPILVAAAVEAVAVPVLFYPFAKTIWVALELTLKRMD